MDIYHYHAGTGRFLSKQEGGATLVRDEWLIPAFATSDEPPQVPEGKFPAFLDGAWVLLDEPEPVAAPEQPVETPEQAKVRLARVVQNVLDTAAQAQDFDNIFTAVTYADEPAIARFQIMGAALRAWRSLVWAASYSVMDEVLVGSRPIPTEAELISELPTFVPPVI